jgi:hypothetical protein
MKKDSVVQGIREIRHEIERECHNDPEAFAKWLIASQRKLEGRLVRRQPIPLRSRNTIK